MSFSSSTVSWSDLIGDALAGWFEVGRRGGYAGPSPVVREVPVTPETGLALPTALACVRERAQAFGSLPKRVFRRRGNGRERVDAHPLVRLFEKPNPEIDGFTYWTTAGHHRVAWGDSFAEIEYDANGQAVALWWLLPHCTRRVRVDNNSRQTIYRTVINGQTVGLPPYRVLHIPGFGYDGMRGYSPIELARRTFEIGLAGAEFAARFFANGAHPGLVLQTDKTLSKGAAERVRAEFEILSGGLSNAHRIAVLEEGLKAENLGLSQRDAEYLSTQEFTADQVCSMFGVPPFIVQIYRQAHYNNAENGMLVWATGTVRYDATAFESVVNDHPGLFLERERPDLYVQCVLEALLRGDGEARWKAHTAALMAGAVTPGQIAEIEDYPPVPDEEGGSRHYINSVLVPLERAGQKPAKRPEAAP